MAVAFNLSDVRRFPEGTSVKAYPVSNWPSGIVDTSAAPVGTETETQTVTNGTAAFVALTDNTEYVAYAAPNSVKTYTFFTAGADYGPLGQQEADNVHITGGSITGITDLAVADGGTGASSAATARTNLGLGTIATQAASSVAITGGSVTGITDLAVADGGTGSSTAADARTALGLGTMATKAAANYDRDNGHTGIVAPGCGGWFISATGPAANTVYLHRFVPSRDMSITKIGFVTHNAATANDAIDVGIYSADLQTRLVSSGATTGVANATAGPQAITVASTPLLAGVVYYAAFAYGAIGGSVAVVAQANFNNVTNAAALFGTTAGLAESLTKASSHPLPTSISSPTVSIIGPVLAVRES